jgi:hypothetical protein
MADHVIDQPLSVALPDLVQLIVGDVGDLEAFAVDQ